MAFWAASEVALAAWIVPFTIPGGKPATAVPGLTPRSPLTTVGPVLVTVEPPRTAKLPAAPSGGATAMADSRPSVAGRRGLGARSACAPGTSSSHPVCARARAAIRTGTRTAKNARHGEASTLGLRGSPTGH